LLPAINLHYEVAVACVDFIGNRGGVLLGTPNKDSYSISSISSSMVAKRKSRIEGDISVSYDVPDNMMEMPIFFHRFRCVLDLVLER